jgi:hypothetical protein
LLLALVCQFVHRRQIYLKTSISRRARQLGFQPGD